MSKSRSKVPMWVNCMSVVLIGTMAQFAEAQRSGRSGLRLGNVSAVQLMVLEDVQKNLKLTEEHKEKTVAIHDKLIAERRKMFAEVSRESGERGPKLTEMNKRTTTKLESILDAAQRQRLKEILLQVNGAAELLKDKIAAAIGITDDQKERLADIQRSYAKTRRDSRKKLGGSSALIRTAKMAELHREAEKKLLEVLTAEQREQFEAMQGKKITLELYQL